MEPKSTSQGSVPRSAASQMLDTVISGATSWVALTLAIAVAPGLAMWPLANVDELGYEPCDVDLGSISK